MDVEKCLIKLYNSYEIEMAFMSCWFFNGKRGLRRTGFLVGIDSFSR